MVVSIVSVLRDASYTVYVRGQWVYIDGSGEVQYRIVEFILFCSGDYLVYNLWGECNQSSGFRISFLKLNIVINLEF